MNSFVDAGFHNESKLVSSNSNIEEGFDAIE